MWKSFNEWLAILATFGADTTRFPAPIHQWQPTNGPLSLLHLKNHLKDQHYWRRKPFWSAIVTEFILSSQIDAVDSSNVTALIENVESCSERRYMHNWAVSRTANWNWISNVSSFCHWTVRLEHSPFLRNADSVLVCPCGGHQATKRDYPFPPVDYQAMADWGALICCGFWWFKDSGLCSSSHERHSWRMNALSYSNTNDHGGPGGWPNIKSLTWSANWLLSSRMLFPTLQTKDLHRKKILKICKIDGIPTPTFQISIYTTFVRKTTLPVADHSQVSNCLTL